MIKRRLFADERSCDNNNNNPPSKPDYSSTSLLLPLSHVSTLVHRPSQLILAVEICTLRRWGFSRKSYILRMFQIEVNRRERGIRARVAGRGAIGLKKITFCRASRGDSNKAFKSTLVPTSATSINSLISISCLASLGKSRLLAQTSSNGKVQVDLK